MISYDICIHGAGFVGQTLALLLARSGLKVVLQDAPKSHRENGAEYNDIRAFALNAFSKDLLESINGWPTDYSVTPIKAMLIYGDTDGKTQFVSTKKDSPLNWLVDVPALATKLKEQVSRDTRIVCQATPAQANLHIICEGKHSRLRSELGIETSTTPYEQHAIAARLQCERPHQATARQWFNDRGEILALLPIGGVDSSEVALVWSLKTSHAKDLMQVNDADFVHELRMACSSALGDMRLTSPRAPWPLFMTEVEQWCGQTEDMIWVLAGDAAHAVHPLAGQGLNLGLADAATLVNAIQGLLYHSPSFNITASNMLRALRKYARARKAATMQMMLVTDSLHLLFAHHHPLASSARNFGMKFFNRLHSLKKVLIKKAQYGL